MIHRGNILITGGSKGIGKAIAMEFAARECNIFLVARGQEALDSARAEIRAAHPGVRVETASCDVSDYAAVCRAVQSMRDSWGAVDGVVCNAGIAIPRYFTETPPEEFRRVLEIDYLGSVWTAHAAVPWITRGGFIAFTSSVAGYMGVFGYTGYSPAKFAQIGFAEALEQELLERGIQVAVLCPPDTDTPGYAAEGATKPFETAELAKTASLMRADEVARRFVDALERGKFLINVNLSTKVLYRMKGAMPGLSRRLIHSLVRRAQRKKTARGS